MVVSNCRSSSDQPQDDFSIPSCEILLKRASRLRYPVDADLLDDLGAWQTDVAMTGVPAADGRDLGAASAAEPLGPISITPPTNRQSTLGDNLDKISGVGGLDWMQWSCYGSWQSDKFLVIKQLLNEAQRKAQDGDEANGLTTIFGEQVRVLPSGVRRGLYCKWALEWMGVEISFTDSVEENENIFNIQVIARSTVSMECGTALYGVICSLLKSWGFNQSRSVVSRIDLAADLVGVEVKEFTEAEEQNRVIGRYRHSDHHRDRRKPEGITLGRSAIMLRCYDKRKEILQGSDYVKTKVMIEKKWQGSMPEAATRVEFQLKRDCLRLMGIDSMEDMIKRLVPISKWLTEEWIRFTDEVPNRSHTERCEGSKLWKSVQDALYAAFSSPNKEPIVLRRIRRADPLKLIKQISGCASTAMAIAGKIPKTLEEVGQVFLEMVGPEFTKLIQMVPQKRSMLETKEPLERIIQPEPVREGQSWRYAF